MVLSKSQNSKVPQFTSDPCPVQSKKKKHIFMVRLTLGGVEAGLVSELPAGASGFLVEFDEPLPLSDFSDD